MDLTNSDLIDAILALNEGGGNGGGNAGGDTDGKPEPADKGGDDQGDDDGDDEDDDEPLGEKGKKALDAEKERRRAATRELRSFKELGYTPEQIAEMAAKHRAAAKGSGESEDQKDAEELVRQAREETRREVAAEALRDRVHDKIEAKAAKAFADAEDATAILLRTSKIDDFLDADNKIDVEAITDALNKLGENKPHLLAQGKRFQGGGDGGARPHANKRPSSLGEAVTTKMSNR